MRSAFLRTSFTFLVIITIYTAFSIIPFSGRASIVYASEDTSSHQVSTLISRTAVRDLRLTDQRQLGPWNGTIYFQGGTPVGGWYSLTLFSNGSSNFSGNFHVSGAPSYNTAIACTVKSGSGTTYLFTHTGRVHGTFEAGSRDDNWNDSKTNPALAAGWADLTGKWSWVCSYGAGLSIGSIIKNAEDVIGAVGPIIAFF